MTMIAIRCGIAMSIVGAAAPAALLLIASPAAAKHGVRQVEVGPIWNQMDAEKKCRKAARDTDGTWTGEWRTTRPGQMSVCDIAGGHGGGGGGGKGTWISIGGHGGKGKWVEAGPIWNDADADGKCRRVARSVGGKWTGQWKTTKVGRMSVCQVKRK
jgi:hypothetical protein